MISVQNVKQEIISLLVKVPGNKKLVGQPVDVGNKVIYYGSVVSSFKDDDQKLKVFFIIIVENDPNDTNKLLITLKPHLTIDLRDPKEHQFWGKVTDQAYVPSRSGSLLTDLGKLTEYAAQIIIDNSQKDTITEYIVNHPAVQKYLANLNSLQTVIDLGFGRFDFNQLNSITQASLTKFQADTLRLVEMKDTPALAVLFEQIAHFVQTVNQKLRKIDTTFDLAAQKGLIKLINEMVGNRKYLPRFEDKRIIANEDYSIYLSLASNNIDAEPRTDVTLCAVFNQTGTLGQVPSAALRKFGNTYAKQYTIDSPSYKLCDECLRVAKAAENPMIVDGKTRNIFDEVELVKSL